MLDVSECTRNPGTQYLFHVEQAMVPQEIGGERITFDPADLTGIFFADDDGNVTVDGKLTVVAHARCANCLKPAQTTVEGNFRETFLRDGDPEDDEIFAYSGHVVSLEKLALSYMLFNLPMRMLCREDCEGHRQYLSQDNASDSPKEAPGQFPFAALGQLLEFQGSSAEEPEQA